MMTAPAENCRLQAEIPRPDMDGHGNEAQPHRSAKSAVFQPESRPRARMGMRTKIRFPEPKSDFFLLTSLHYGKNRV